MCLVVLCCWEVRYRVFLLGGCRRAIGGRGAYGVLYERFFYFFVSTDLSTIYLATYSQRRDVSTCRFYHHCGSRCSSPRVGCRRFFGRYGDSNYFCDFCGVKSGATLLALSASRGNAMAKVTTAIANRRNSCGRRRLQRFCSSCVTLSSRLVKMASVRTRGTVGSNNVFFSGLGFYSVSCCYRGKQCIFSLLYGGCIVATCARGTGNETCWVLYHVFLFFISRFFGRKGHIYVFFVSHVCQRLFGRGLQHFLCSLDDLFRL